MSAREEFLRQPVGSMFAFGQWQRMCDEIDRLRANQATPAVQAVLDAVGHAVSYHQACLSLAAGPSLPDYAAAWDLFLAAMADLADANAARRAAAGGVL